MAGEIVRWIEWIKCIEGELTELCVGRDIYKQILQIFQQNPEIQKANIFYSWMRGHFVTRSVVMVGCLVDDTKGTQSFTKLLRDIHSKPNLISREYLISAVLQGMKAVPEEAPRLANHTFDQLVGPGRKALERKQVGKDIKELADAVRPIKDLRDERIAHLSANPSSQLPTYSQLDVAINFSVELLNKYSLLIRGISAETYPTIQYDWQAIFRVPWIPNRSGAD